MKKLFLVIIIFSSFAFMKIIDSEDVKANATVNDQYKATDWCPTKGGGCFHLEEVVIIATR